MNSPKTKAGMSAAGMNSPDDLPVPNHGIAERDFAERVQTNKHRLRSELKPGARIS
jgi:hypothetical protein